MTDDARRGLLGHGSILTRDVARRLGPRRSCAASGFSRTCSARRRRRRRPMCPPLKENEEGRKPQTMREQMAEHRANPVCASCHKMMDPLGFALENFDAVGAMADRGCRRADRRVGRAGGRHRDRRAVSLRQAILARPESSRHDDREAADPMRLAAASTITTCRSVRAILRDRRRADYRFSSVILGVVASVPFQMRMSQMAGRSNRDVHHQEIVAPPDVPAGLGASVALPLLDAMVPGASPRNAKTAAGRRCAFGAVYVPNGAIMEHGSRRRRARTSSSRRSLKPLEPFRDQLVVVSNLREPIPASSKATTRSAPPAG